MKIKELPDLFDQYAMQSAQHRNKNSRHPRRIKMKNTAIAKAAAEKAKKLKSNPSAAKAKKPSEKKPKYDKNAVFSCEVKGCDKKITGPWSYKQHLINVHGYTPEQAGLNPRKKAAKKAATKKSK